jgi:hypothetical protein
MRIGPCDLALRVNQAAKTARRGCLALPWQLLRYRVGRTVLGERGYYPQQDPFLLRGEGNYDYDGGGRGMGLVGRGGLG